ncbi:hypothetical protein HYT32_00050 [Candidatus Roizmanbacteria bacterium]|nr:hypothetical protein [Candidatus Roizmanbacteria bacterium]
MTLNPIIFFDLVITIFILALTIVILVIYFLRSIKKLRLDRMESERNNEDETTNRAVRIINEANNKSLDIIQKANLFANTSSDYFSKELKAITELELKGFEKTTSDFINMYQNILNELKAKNIEIFQNISKNIETSTLAEIKKFEAFVEQETIDSQKMVKRKIRHEYSLAKKHIDAYTESELKMVDEKIYEILETVSKLVLGKSLKLSDHETLIIDSLEKAKKERIFDEK